MVDHSADWPLWLPDGMTTPDVLGLSEALTAGLAEWQAAFDAGFDPERGWRAAATRERHASLGEQLHQQLMQEVGRLYAVVLDDWPSAP